jgi:hypothetical protein
MQSWIYVLNLLAVAQAVIERGEGISQCNPGSDGRARFATGSAANRSIHFA